jgi:hypothetical protein
MHVVTNSFWTAWSNRIHAVVLTFKMISDPCLGIWINSLQATVIKTHELCDFSAGNLSPLSHSTPCGSDHNKVSFSMRLAMILSSEGEKQCVLDWCARIEPLAGKGGSSYLLWLTSFRVTFKREIDKLGDFWVNGTYRPISCFVSKTKPALKGDLKTLRLFLPVFLTRTKDTQSPKREMRREIHCHK